MKGNIINLLVSIAFIVFAGIAFTYFIKGHVENKVNEAREKFNFEQNESLKQSLKDMEELNEKIEELTFELQKADEKFIERNKMIEETVNELNRELDDVNSSIILKNTIRGLQK